MIVRLKRGTAANACVMTVLVALLFACRPAPQAEPPAQPSAQPSEEEAPPETVQPGRPAPAVLVPPVITESDGSGTVLGRGDPGERPRSSVSLTQEKDKGLFHVSIQDPYAEMFDIGEGMIVRLRGGGARRKPGSPDISGLVWVLPGKPGLNLIPTVTDAAFAVATQGVDIAAVPAPVAAAEDGEDAAPTYERVPSPELYEQDALFPSHVIRVQEVWMGTNKLVRLIVNPVQYNPVTKSLQLCYRLKADLEYVEALVPEEVPGQP